MATRIDSVCVPGWRAAACIVLLLLRRFRLCVYSSVITIFTASASCCASTESGFNLIDKTPLLPIPLCLLDEDEKDSLS